MYKITSVYYSIQFLAMLPVILRGCCGLPQSLLLNAGYNLEVGLDHLQNL
jgi:hypothetical protein